MIEINREGLRDGEFVVHVCGDLVEPAEKVVRRPESELPGFGQPGGIPFLF